MTFDKDLFKTTAGDFEITFIGHGTLMFQFNNSEQQQGHGVLQ